MKKSQNLLFNVVAMFATLVAYVVALAQLPGDPHILYVLAAGLGVCALAQLSSDLLEGQKSREK